MATMPSACTTTDGKNTVADYFSCRWQLEIGIRQGQVDDKIWLVSFLDYDLGYFDESEGRVEPGPNPFNPEV